MKRIDGYVIMCEGWNIPGPCPATGMYLERYEPGGGEERWSGQTGKAVDGPLWTWTPDGDKALSFVGPNEALALYRAPITKSDGTPVLRWDGKPERPLTGFTVSIVPYQDQEDDDVEAQPPAEA
jgi:hypothetical protein